MVFAVQAANDEIVTVEGLMEDQRLHPLQEAFWQNDAVECGYCTPGMLMSAYGLLEKVKDPSEEQIKKAISGNLCRCTGYHNIVAAIKKAAANFAK
jgi:carbon-monoxide dehydrogenase small subunit